MRETPSEKTNCMQPRLLIHDVSAFRCKAPLDHTVSAAGICTTQPSRPHHATRLCAWPRDKHGQYQTHTITRTALAYIHFLTITSGRSVVSPCVLPCPAHALAPSPPCQSSSLPAKAATLPEAFTCMSNTAKTSPCNAYASCACSRAANALLSARKANATSASDAGAPLRKAALQARERTSCKRHHGRSQSGSIAGGTMMRSYHSSCPDEQLYP